MKLSLRRTASSFRSLIQLIKPINGIINTYKKENTTQSHHKQTIKRKTENYQQGYQQKKIYNKKTFRNIKRWFKSHACRYKGMAKTHSQHILEAICYNLYRQPIVG